MNDLVEFYEGILKTLDIKVDSNKQLFIKSDVDSPLMIDGKPAYLPTTDNIRTATEIVNGNTQWVKHIFNPLDENAIRGESKSLTKLKDVIELKMLGIIYQIGESLFSKLSTGENIDNIEVAKFVAQLNKYKAQGIKQMIDAKTVENWYSIYENILTESYQKRYVEIFLKRGGKIDNVKYNRVGAVGFPFFEELSKYDPKNGNFLGVKLRKKDIHAFKSLFEYMFGKEDQLLHGFKFGSLNKTAPATHVLLTIYDFLYKSVSKTIDSLVSLGIDNDVAERLNILPLHVTSNNVGDVIDSLSALVKTIPKDAVAATNMANSQQPQNQQQKTAKKTTGSFWDRVKDTQPVITQPVQQQVIQQPFQQQTIQQPVQQQVVQQPMMLQQPMMVQQPVQQIQQNSSMPPISNTAMVPDDPWATPQVVQQPMMLQQPMMVQQPMMGVPSMNNNNGW